MDATQTLAEVTRCERCHRPLKSEAARAAKLGSRCAAIIAATEGLNTKQADKVTEVIADGGVVATSRKGVYRVTSTDGTASYLTHVNGNCSCSWGLRRTSADTKTCYHVAAARLTAKPVIRASKPAPVAIPAPRADSDLWAELDRLNAAFMTAL